MERGLGLRIVLGGATWVAFAAMRGPFSFDALFLSAPLLVVPLALALVPTPHRRGVAPRLHRLATALQLPAALAVALSFLLPPGAPAAALTAPWLALTALLALHGLARFLTRGPGPIEEIAIDLALLYAPVGGAWLVASRAGIGPLGFAEPVVLLTAVHFHYAAFAMLVLAGALGRAILPSRAEPAYRVAIFLLAAGPVLLAAGITASRALEVAGALAMASGVLLTLGLAAAWRARFAPLALLALMPMSAAIVFATRGVALDLMARVHGAANVAIVLAGLAMLVGGASDRAPRGPRAGAPFSALRSRTRTGPDFFERIGATEQRAVPPTGLVDDLASYARRDFDPARVAPEIRAFYERTQDHALLVVPHWRPGFRPLGRVYGVYARAVAQMCFPLETPPEGRLVRSVILGVRSDVDGRDNVRAWVRTYVDSGEPVYVAAYSTHEERGQTYMNIAFPFPGWNLTSVLRLEAIEDGRGVNLTTFATPRTWGDQGVYAVARRWRVRLPINETIRVWTPDLPSAPFQPVRGGVTVLARHEISVFGVRFLTLDYHIWPERALPEAGSSTG